MKDKFVMNKIFCCPGFQHNVEAAGGRGIAVIVVNTMGQTRFLLQSRGVAFEDREKLSAIPSTLDLRINVSCEIGLQYCPACGCNLQKLLNKSPEAFEELAEKHKKFFTGP